MVLLDQFIIIVDLSDCAGKGVDVSLSLHINRISAVDESKEVRRPMFFCYYYYYYVKRNYNGVLNIGVVNFKKNF